MTKIKPTVNDKINYALYGDPPIGRRAFFCVGAEGSGTYMLRNALVAAGCFADGRLDGIHEDYKFETAPHSWSLAIRRSYPHAGEWPYLGQVVNPLLEADYDVTVLWIIREWNATAKSVERRTGTRHLPVFANVAKATTLIARQLDTYRFDVRMFMVSYEAFCLTPGYRRWLFEDMLSLTNPVDFKIKYANDQYYAEKS